MFNKGDLSRRPYRECCQLGLQSQNIVLAGVEAFHNVDRSPRRLV